MSEPDDRPGSDDPEDPSELLRLIGRTVPRSPHAADPGPDPDTDTDERPSPAHRASRNGPVQDGNVTLDTASVADEAASEHRDARFGPDEGVFVHLDGPGSAAAPGEFGDPETDDPETDDPDPDDAASDGAADADPEDADPEDADPEDTDPEAPDPDDLADDTELELALEALLLVVDAPIDEASLADALSQPPSRIRQTLNRMALAYTADRRGIDLRRAGEGWRFYTRDRYAPYVEKLLLDGQRARLTRAALETLAVVAYRQPVTRARVSAVRGVNCDGVLRTLLTRGLVEEAGTEEQTGGTLFRTTELFLERLGLSSVQELPPLAPLLPDIDAIDDLDG